MNYYAEISTLVGLSGISLISFIISIKKYKSLNWITSLCYLFHALLLSIVALEVLMLRNTLSYNQFLKYYYSISSSFIGISIFLLILFSLKELSLKKIKTIWRIPIITFFIGSLTFDSENYLVWGPYCILSVLFLKQLKKLKSHYMLIFGTFIFFLVLIQKNSLNVWQINLLSIWILILLSRSWDKAHIKYFTWKNADD